MTITWLYFWFLRNWKTELPGTVQTKKVRFRRMGSVSYCIPTLFLKLLYCSIIQPDIQKILPMIIS